MSKQSDLIRKRLKIIIKADEADQHKTHSKQWISKSTDQELKEKSNGEQDAASADSELRMRKLVIGFIYEVNQFRELNKMQNRILLLFRRVLK